MRLEKRNHTSPAAYVLAPVGAVVFTLIVSALLVLWAGAPVGQTYALLLQGAFGSVFALTETLTRATPLILTGLAAAVAFRARLFNIGAEGQLYAGALAAVAVGGMHGGTGLEWSPYVLFPLMMLAAAPLLVASEPIAVMLWAFPAAARRRLGGWGKQRWIALPWRVLTEPITATVVQALALWVWHAPALFEAALAREGWHIAQHLSFLVSALLFWSAVLHRRGSRGLAAGCLFATSIIGGALGAFMALSESPWYASYAAMGLAPMGLTPAEDQQLAGLLMWIPGGMVHAVVALALVAAMLRRQPKTA